MSELELPEESSTQNSVKCALHDLHFNPAQSDGCVLCQREERKRQASAKLRNAAWGVGLVLLFLAALQGAWTDWSSDPARAEAPASKAAPSDEDLGFSLAAPGKINPETYRETILEIEDVLYMPSPPSSFDIEKAAAASRRLSRQIRSREDRLTSGKTALELLTWGANLDPDTGYADPDLGPGRKAWEELRRNIFQDAPWFNHSGEQAAAAQTAPPPRIDSRVVSALKDVGNDVNHLIRTARIESDAIGEVTGDNLDDPRSTEIRRRWERWSRNWVHRVRRVMEKMPQAPAPTDNLNLIMAYQRMATALRKLSVVNVAANDSGMPFLYERNTRFESARRNLEEAESYLGKISPR